MPNIILANIYTLTSNVNSATAVISSVILYLNIIIPYKRIKLLTKFIIQIYLI